jgi:hypothetical protein
MFARAPPLRRERDFPVAIYRKRGESTIRKLLSCERLSMGR